MFIDFYRRIGVLQFAESFESLSPTRPELLLDIGGGSMVG